MTPEEFVNVLRLVALDQVIESTISTIERPPGRGPRQELVELRDWYKGLAEHDHSHVRQVAALAAHAALHRVLSVLDGVVAVEDTPDKGAFQLIFRKGPEERVLNPPDGEFLHDLLNLVRDPGA
jgi:hypothetical protein